MTFLLEGWEGAHTLDNLYLQYSVEQKWKSRHPCHIPDLRGKYSLFGHEEGELLYK